MKKLAETSGLLFFYRSKNPYDTRQIPILEDFCRKFGFELIPVSVDGEVSPELPKSRLDRGQAARLNVRYFPAVLLVNPQAKITQPVAFGLTTQDVLTARLMQVRGASK
jgi:conjugal transfer pilus assembly protein TraF